MKALRIARSTNFSLIFNIAYAIGNCIIAFITHSWWFITIGAYYTVLATTRFSVLKIKRKANENYDTEQFAKRITGVMLILLSFCLIGINVLSAMKERGTKFNEIIMITIATYSFIKITIAIVGNIKSNRISSTITKTLRNISFADAVVSIYTLQRSMLVSFPGIDSDKIIVFNILTGTATWIIVLILGVNLIGGKYIDMAKSKIVKANQKIAEVVTDGYNKIEKGVTEGFKKIENGVVEGYTKIEDKFVDAYLTKDGETVEEAKKRLKER